MQQARLLRNRGATTTAVIGVGTGAHNPSRAGFGGHTPMHNVAGAATARASAYPPVDARAAGAETSRSSARVADADAAHATLTRDILHVQTRLSDMARTAPAGSPRGWNVPQNHLEKDLPAGSQDRTRLHEILLELLVRLQQAALCSVDARAATPARGDASSSSRLPHFYALIARLTSLSAERDALLQSNEQLSGLVESSARQRQDDAAQASRTGPAEDAAATSALHSTYTSALHELEREAEAAGRAAAAARAEADAALDRAVQAEALASVANAARHTADEKSSLLASRLTLDASNQATLAAHVAELEAQLRRMRDEADLLRAEAAVAGEATTRNNAAQAQVESCRRRLTLAEQAADAERARSRKLAEQLSATRNELSALTAAQRESAEALAEARGSLEGVAKIEAELGEERAARERADREVEGMRKEAALLADAEVCIATIHIVVCVCVCVYIYIYMCVCIYLSIYLSISISIYICIYIYIYIYIYIHAYIHIYTHLCIYIYVYMYIYMCDVFTYMYICIYICVCIRIICDCAAPVYTCIYTYIYMCVYLFIRVYMNAYERYATLFRLHIHISI